MVYVKLIDSDGFVSVATLNAETGGNSTKEEHDTIEQMYKDASPGLGVIETKTGFAYAPRPAPEEPITEEEALTRYANELTGAQDETLTEATETLIKKVMEE
jgi:hypothetical protein